MKKRYSSLLLVVTQVLYAQETIQTDRPDQSITPKAIFSWNPDFL